MVNRVSLQASTCIHWIVVSGIAATTSSLYTCHEGLVTLCMSCHSRLNAYLHQWIWKLLYFCCYCTLAIIHTMLLPYFLWNIISVWVVSCLNLKLVSFSIQKCLLCACHQSYDHFIVSVAHTSNSRSSAFGTEHDLSQDFHICNTWIEFWLQMEHSHWTCPHFWVSDHSYTMLRVIRPLYACVSSL